MRRGGFFCFLEDIKYPFNQKINMKPVRNIKLFLMRCVIN